MLLLFLAMLADPVETVEPLLRVPQVGRGPNGLLNIILDSYVIVKVIDT